MDVKKGGLKYGKGWNRTVRLLCNRAGLKDDVRSTYAEIISCDFVHRKGCMYDHFLRRQSLFWLKWDKKRKRYVPMELKYGQNKWQEVKPVTEYDHAATMTEENYINFTMTLNDEIESDDENDDMKSNGEDDDDSIDNQ